MSGYEKIQQLRNEAEKILENLDTAQKHTPLGENVARLLKELSNHLDEVRMQNDELQRTQQELENQKNKYKELYQQAPVAYITIAPGGNIVAQNQKARQIFETSGYNHHSISIFHFIGQTSENNFRQMLNNAFVLQQEQHGEVIVTTANKHTLHTEMRIAPFFDKEKHLDVCRIAITSIESVHRVFHQQLRESEEKYRELAENISEGIYLTENGNIKMVNTPACALFGFSMDEMIGRTVWDFVKSDQKESIKALFRTKVANLDGSPVDLECVRKDGSIFWGEISMRIIKDQSRVFGVVSDISARKKTEEALRRSEQRLFMALKGTKAGLWDWNIENGSLTFDERWVEILGYNMQEIEPHISSLKKLIHPEDFDEVENKIADHIQGKTEFYQSTHRLKDKQGKWKYMLDSGMVVERNASGKAIRAVGTVQDMTNAKKTEAKLREINSTKDKLFSIIAHDLKSPYNAQLGFLELLIEEEGAYTYEQRKKFIHTVYHSTKQSFSLLDNLLMWSRTQTGKIPFNPVELLIAQMFEEVIDQQKYAAVAKHIMIDTNLCHENLMAIADYEMVSTILRNLISNAIKFTPKNGRIVLGGKVASDNKCLIYVKDTGVGIAAENIERLFDAYNNYTTIGTNREKGTGIGLIICKDFVERNGGKIWIKSEVGKGSIFYFTLDNSKNTKKYHDHCIQNLQLVNEKINQNEELHQYFLKTIIPFFRQTYKKFSKEQINSFIDELESLAKRHQIDEFTAFSKMIVKSLQHNDFNQINICFAEFEKLADNLEIVAARNEK